MIMGYVEIYVVLYCEYVGPHGIYLYDIMAIYMWIQFVYICSILFYLIFSMNAIIISVRYIYTYMYVYKSLYIGVYVYI